MVPQTDCSARFAWEQPNLPPGAPNLTSLTILEFRAARGCDLRVPGLPELILRTNPGS